VSSVRALLRAAAPGILSAAAVISLAAGPAPFGAAGPAQWARYSVLSPAGPAEPPESIFPEIHRLIFARHQVERGESNVAILARRFGTTPMGLESTNGSDLLLLHPGETIAVLNKNGLLYRVHKKEETLDAVVARFYRNPRQAEAFKRSVIEANGLPGIAMLEPYELFRGTQILLPGVRVRFDTYRYPFKGFGWGRISSGFGLRYHPILHRYRFHDGFDIPRPWGTPVYPSRSGRVVYAGWMGGYGNLIILRHSDGATTRYGHLSKILVKVGEFVVRGRTLIGRVGSTGLSTGPHLHFEVRDKYGHALNPGREIGRL
jgi:murein DD-endopeptidase MepM/ murein hydrolase activator NlpD